MPAVSLLKVYPLSDPDRKGKAVNCSGRGANTLPPEDGSYFSIGIPGNG